MELRVCSRLYLINRPHLISAQRTPPTASTDRPSVDTAHVEGKRQIQVYEFKGESRSARALLLSLDPGPSARRATPAAPRCARCADATEGGGTGGWPRRAHRGSWLCALAELFRFRPELIIISAELIIFGGGENNSQRGCEIIIRGSRTANYPKNAQADPKNAKATGYMLFAYRIRRPLVGPT